MHFPLVPFATVVDSWDHHWFLWLPLHPVYEAVEVASREPDRDGRNGGGLILGGLWMRRS